MFQINGIEFKKNLEVYLGGGGKSPQIECTKSYTSLSVSESSPQL